jgi:hypothetical protein
VGVPIGVVADDAGDESMLCARVEQQQQAWSGEDGE